MRSVAAVRCPSTETASCPQASETHTVESLGVGQARQLDLLLG